MDWYNSFLLIMVLIFAGYLIYRADILRLLRDSFNESLYYECHITIDPIFEEERDKLQNLIKPWFTKRNNERN